MKHIAIVGGGIGGLCLAQGLKKSNLDFSVYERNYSEQSWLEGYRIHIRPIGARSLHECLPTRVWEEFLGSTAAPTDGFGFLTEDLVELVHIEEELMTGPHQLPEQGQYNVSRRLLRQVLIKGIEDHIHYNKTFERYELREDHRINVFFTDGSTLVTDILVGADGANSRVRKQLLPEARRIDTQAVAIGGKMYLNKENPDWLPTCLSSRMNVTMPRDKYFFFNAVYRKEEENYILWSFIAHENEFNGATEDTDLKALVMDKIKNWHPAFRQLVMQSDKKSLLCLPLKTMLPVRPWNSGPVTLLGDAIHNMTPLQGMGANMALFDAATLSQKLTTAVKSEKDHLQAIHEYEAIMLKTGFKAVDTSLKYTKQAISGNRFARKMSRMWFSLCQAVPLIKRMTFGNNWK